MEQYAARDERPQKACEEDVAKRDVYVGVFAWRYGYVPDKPKNRKSITELEYLQRNARGSHALCSSLTRTLRGVQR